MKRKTNLFGKGGPLSIDHIDIPIIVMLGGALGFLISGVIQVIIGGLCEPAESIWSMPAIGAGFGSIGLSMLIAVVGWLYWLIVFKRYRAVMPRFSGFGLVLALMSLLSAVMLSAELYAHILYR